MHAAMTILALVTAFVGSRLVAAAFTLMAIGVAAPVAAQPSQPVAAARLALLIANTDYSAPDTHASLPGKAARSLADELRHEGFSVDLRENLGRDAMRRAVLDLAARVGRGDSVLFFFSGYGIQVAQSTFLVPVDADIWTEKDVAARSLSLGEILGAFDDAGAKVKLVILDASRRNPFERRFRTLSMGLRPTALPEASLLISAAGEGEVVDDSDGETSIFISELLKEMRAPDLTAQDIIARTKLGVARATNGRQRPFVLSTLADNVTLGLSRGAPGAETRAKGPAPSVGKPTGEPSPGQVFRDCDRCPDVVVIGPGEFSMGSDDFETEKPVHRAVVAKHFALGRTEVTLAQWDACVADGGCSSRPSDQGRGRTDLPVGEVSWRDAVAYVDWLTRASGQAYRLPTEAEWEYAARAGSTTAFWWGGDPGAGLANCRGCGGDGGRQTLAVGSYPANPFGLVDTAGNVAEWVEDCWTDSYRAAPAGAVTRATGACKQRILRGGSFDAGPRYVRSSSRFPYDPDLRYYLNGIRVLRELP